jgi:hypothetical protein
MIFDYHQMKKIKKQAVDGLLCVFSLAYHSKPILIY